MQSIINNDILFYLFEGREGYDMREGETIFCFCFVFKLIWTHKSTQLLLLSIELTSLIFVNLDFKSCKWDFLKHNKKNIKIKQKKTFKIWGIFDIKTDKKKQLRIFY